MSLYLNKLLLVILSLVMTISLSATFLPAISNTDEDGVGGTGHKKPSSRPTTLLQGHITKFGSIYINNMHVHYNKTTPIYVNAEKQTLYQLKLGQVVKITAIRKNNQYHAQKISVDYVIAGKITMIDNAAAKIRIMNSTIILKQQQLKQVKLGQWLKVSGYTDRFGNIYATHISNAKHNQYLLAGVGLITNNKLYVRNTQIKYNKTMLINSSDYLILKGDFSQKQFIATSVKKEKLDDYDNSVKYIILQGYFTQLPDGSYTIANSGIKFPIEFVKKHFNKRVTIKLKRIKRDKYKVEQIWTHSNGISYRLKQILPLLPKWKPNEPERYNPMETPKKLELPNARQEPERYEIPKVEKELPELPEFERERPNPRM